MNTSDNQYIKKLEKQNEELRDKLNRLSIVEEKFDYFKQFMSDWLLDINKEILQTHSDFKTLNSKDLEKVYEKERKNLLQISRDLQRLQKVVDCEEK